RARKEVMSGEMNDPAERLKNVQSFHLLSDRNYYYFASQTAPPNGGAAMAMPDVMMHLGMRAVPVSGFLHAFERKSGNLVWDSPVKTPQFLVLEQFEDLPLLFLASRTFNNPNAAMGGVIMRGGRMGNVNATEVKVTS